MQKSYNLYILILIILLISCEEKFDAHLNGKYIPVVHGIYNLKLRKNNYLPYYLDTPNYISLTKTFMGGQNAYKIAKVADSIYFQNAIVNIEYCFRGDIIGNNTLVKTTDFQKVPGMFSSSNNVIYETTSHYVPQYFDTLRLIIDTGNEGELYISETSYVSSPVILRPKIFPTVSVPIGFYRETPFYLEWIDFGGYYEILMTINYIERKHNKNYDKKLFLKKTQLSKKEKDYSNCDWYERFQNTYPPDQYKKSYIKSYFYGDDLSKFIKSSIIDDPDVVARKIQSIDLSLTATTRSFYDFLKFGNNIQDNGQIYSNIKNGIGIFTSACTDSVTGLTLDYQTEDSIANGQYTKHLKFVTYNIGIE